MRKGILALLALVQKPLHNLSRFRLGAWKLNVNNINLKHINRNMRFVIIALIEIIISWKMKSM